MRLIRALMLAGAAASGCGGPQSNAAGDQMSHEAAVTPAAGPRACDVLTEADAAKALGRPVEKLPADGGPAGLDMCQYGYQGERLMDTGQATLTLQPVDLASLRQGVVDQGYQVETVPGVGDQAFWSDEAGLYVGKGNRSATYLVGVGGADPASNKQRAIELAKATIARI